MNKKLITDIAIWPTANDPAGTSSQIAHCLLLLLRFEYQYKLAPYNRITITPAAGPAGEFKVIGFDKFNTSSCCLEIGQFETADSKSFEFWLDLISNLLKTLAHQESSDIEPIEEARLKILANQTCTTVKMTNRVKKTRKYLIEPEFKLKNSYAGYLLYVRLTELATGSVAYRFIAQGELYEILGISKSFAITNGQLVMYPKPTWMYLASYRSRGFTAPLKIPLANFQFSNQTSQNIH